MSAGALGSPLWLLAAPRVEADLGANRWSGAVAIAVERTAPAATTTLLLVVRAATVAGGAAIATTVVTAATARGGQVASRATGGHPYIEGCLHRNLPFVGEAEFLEH
jgi:hypothetical protein